MVEDGKGGLDCDNCEIFVLNGECWILALLGENGEPFKLICSLLLTGQCFFWLFVLPDVDLACSDFSSRGILIAAATLESRS